MNEFQQSIRNLRRKQAKAERKLIKEVFRESNHRCRRTGFKALHNSVIRKKTGLRQNAIQRAAYYSNSLFNGKNGFYYLSDEKISVSSFREKLEGKRI